MQHKWSNTMHPLMFNTVLWLCGVALLYLIKALVEVFSGPISETWMDLTLVLTAYLLLFVLDPIRTRINRRLHKRARRKQARQDTGTGA